MHGRDDIVVHASSFRGNRLYYVRRIISKYIFIFRRARSWIILKIGVPQGVDFYVFTHTSARVRVHTHTHTRIYCVHNITTNIQNEITINVH